MANSFRDKYFERIGYSGSPVANLQTLRKLHLLHLQRIPYENLDVFCLQGVKLDPDSLTCKILQRRRGGYCFEQNGLFLMALTELGFKVTPNLARVHRNRAAPGGRTLSDHTFKVFDLIEGTLERETGTDLDTYVQKLRELLGVELNESERARLKDRLGTLKPPVG